MIGNIIKNRFSYDMYLYKIAMLISIILIPIVIAAISNNVALSYSIGIMSFVFFVLVYNMKKAKTRAQERATDGLNEIFLELDILRNEVRKLNKDIEQKNHEFTSLKASVEKSQMLSGKLIETRHFQERAKLFNDLNIYNHIYDDLILRNRMYSETFNLFIRDLNYYSKDYDSYRYFIELFEKFNEENKNLATLKDKLKQDIDNYLKE